MCLKVVGCVCMDFYKNLSPVPPPRRWTRAVGGGEGGGGEGGAASAAAAAPPPQGRDLPSRSWLSSKSSRLRMSWKKISSTVFSRMLNLSEMLEIDMEPRSVM